MKRILSTLTLLLCFAFTAVNAQVITAERAAEIANSFFSAGVQKSAAARGVVSSPSLTSSFDSNDVTETASAEPTFYVLTNPEGGFVIVSGEETENPIIGYSLDGTIDVNNLPDGFVGYMADVDAQVKSLREYNANNPQKAAAARSVMQRAASYEYNATTMGNIVKNLNTAPWGQRTPFNNLCKTTDGQTALTGCGPTAFAILCYYYKWPASGVGTVTHQGTAENMELGHTYDYANMRNDNYSSGYSEAEANAIAVLMRDLGWANQVGYGTSSTSFSETGQHMVDHFRFKSERPVDHGASLAVVRSTLGNDTQWKTYIKNNLDAGYPIPYASTTNTSNSARHIYILDGYTDNDYYHFNWGWSGQGNGWFTLDNMVPDDYSNYSNSHKAYFNLIPDATTYTVRATATPSNMGTVSINGGTAGTTVSADLLQGVTATLTAHPAQGYALASWTKNGVVVGSRTTLQVPVGTDANDYVANFADESTVTIVQDYTINATSGTTLTTDKIKEWAFNANNDYPAALKLTSTVASINTNNNGDCIQLYLVEKTSETFTLSVPEDYVITEYTIRCKTSSTYITSIAAEGKTYTPTKSYADYTFTKNTQARGAANSSELTIVGSANRALMVEAITVTVAKEGANVPSTPTTYTINVNAETGGNAYVNGTNTRVTVNAGTDVTLQAYPDGTNYTFAGWYNGNSLVSSNNPYTFALNSNVTYTAKFNAVATTCTVTTTANPAEGGTAKFAVGTGSQQTQGDVSNSEVITLYASANTGYTFVNWTLNGNVVGTAATCNVTVSQTANYVANFEAVQQGGSSSTNLAGKYFRLRVKDTTNYMNIANNTEHSGGTTGGVNVTAKNESYGGQIFQFIESGTGYKLLSKTGYYIKCQPWNVDAISVGTVLSFETAGADNEYFIKWDNTNMNQGVERDDYFKAENGYVYCDAASTAATTWVLEEVVYYTVTATAGEGGSVSPLTSTVEQGKPVTLTATANSGYRFVNWTLNGNVVSTDASYTFNATAAGEYVANFEINTYSVSVSANGIGGNAMIGTGNSTTVEHGASVTLTAQANEGYHFVNWTKGGVEVGTTTECTINNITEAGEYVANFAINTYTISVSANGTGGNAMIGTGNSTIVEHGASVTLTAQANDGYHFVNWTKGGVEVGTTTECTINNITEAGEYVANFQLANTPATHCNVTVNANISGNGIAFIHTGTSTDVTSGRYEVGSKITLTAVSDKDENGYLFTGWYVDGDDEPISTEKTYTVTLSSDVIYTAMFEEGWRVRYSCNYRMGYIRVLDADSNDIGGTNYVLVKKGSTIQMLGVPESGYEFKNWTANATSDFVSNNNPYSFAVEENMSLTANFEPEHYVLTVRANNDSYGTVTAESGTFGPAEWVKVGIAMTATITAVEKDGYKFVNWTKDSKIVSTDAIYTVPSVDYSKDLIDTEYVANFEPIENATAGKYYRIAYDFEVPVAAKTAATRAVGDVQTYVVSTSTGSFSADTIWTSTLNNNPAGLKMLATTNNNGKTIASIIPYSTNEYHNFSLKAGGTLGSTDYYSTTYTLSVAPGFKITGYEMTYYPSTGGKVTLTTDFGYTKTPESSSNDYVVRSSDYEFTESEETKFVVSTSAGKLGYSIRIVNFEVYIQEVGGGETPEPEPETVRYYVQSDAVSGTNNAMIMRSEDDENYNVASSIFYYAGNKLLSYKEGRYLNEGSNNTRGLQNVGVEGGDVGIIDNKIKVSSGTTMVYLHANEDNGTYFVDRCTSKTGDDNGDPEHNFIIEEVTSLPVTITDAGYASWYAPVAVKLPGDVKAWYFEGNITKVGDVRYAIMTQIGGNVVPANTGVILEDLKCDGNKSNTYELTITTEPDYADDVKALNQLKGTVATEYVVDGAYVLSRPNDKEIGFYQALLNFDENYNKLANEADIEQRGKYFQNNSHKAYLPKDFKSSGDAQQSAGFVFRFSNNTTAIEEVEAESSEVNAIYDLTGRKLEGISGTGIYIINGKKVIVK